MTARAENEQLEALKQRRGAYLASRPQGAMIALVANLGTLRIPLIGEIVKHDGIGGTVPHAIVRWYEPHSTKTDIAILWHLDGQQGGERTLLHSVGYIHVADVQPDGTVLHDVIVPEAEQLDDVIGKSNDAEIERPASAANPYQGDITHIADSIAIAKRAITTALGRIEEIEMSLTNIQQLTPSTGGK